MPPGQAIGGHRIVIKAMPIELCQPVLRAVVLEMAGSARLRPGFRNPAMPARARGDIARDPLVAGKALRRLRRALPRNVTGGAIPLKPGMTRRQRTRADQPFNHGFGMQRRAKRQQQRNDQKAPWSPHQ